MKAKDAFEFADRVYLCDYCGSQQPDDDKPCPDCGRALFTWAGFLGRGDRFRVGIAEGASDACSS